MVVMGAALHALGTEWSAKLDDMYKRANKSLVMKCRYVEKVKLADLWVTINVILSILLNLSYSQRERGRVKEFIVSLGDLTCLRGPNSLSCLQHSKANRRPRPCFQ